MHMDDNPSPNTFTGLVRELNGSSRLAAHKYAFLPKLTKLLTRIYEVLTL